MDVPGGSSTLHLNLMEAGRWEHADFVNILKSNIAKPSSVRLQDCCSELASSGLEVPEGSLYKAWHVSPPETRDAMFVGALLSTDSIPNQKSANGWIILRTAVFPVPTAPTIAMMSTGTVSSSHWLPRQRRNSGFEWQCMAGLDSNLPSVTHVLLSFT